MAVKNITTKAKPSEDSKAFCVYLISPIYLIIYSKSDFSSVLFGYVAHYH